MNQLFKTILAANNDRELDDWTNVLFVVIMLAFWAIGGILKAKGGKRKQGQQRAARPTPPEQGRTPLRPVQRPETQRPARAAGAEYPKRAITKPAPGAVTQAGAPAPALRTTRPLRSKLLEAFEHLDQARTSSEPPLEPSVLGVLPLHEQGHVFRPAIELDNAEKLRNVVLYYEVLGKPVAFREPYY